MKFKKLEHNNTALRQFIQAAVSEYLKEHSFDIRNREGNMSTLIDKVNWLRSNRITNI